MPLAQNQGCTGTKFSAKRIFSFFLDNKLHI